MIDMRFREPSSVKIVYAFLLIMLAGTANVHAKNGGSSQYAKEQTTFSSEEKISNAVKLPTSVLEQLAKFNDQQLEKCLTLRANKADHFAATHVNINSDKRQDLIVQAQTPCFMGAHNTSFWLFTVNADKQTQNFQLTFDTAVDSLSVLKTYSQGFRDLETRSQTLNEIYTIRWRFDSRKYQPYKCKTINLKTNKVQNVRCNPK
jgi:hypothetical protein